ncbi:MAG: hypothetical protein QM532_03655 [Cyanobium sp. MAG06]|nr:hypothetical protein [Cyanobium sp. MAG06]
MENNNDTKYVNGAPLIHSLGDDIGINNNHSSPPEIDIHNAINDLDKEKKIKMIIIVIIAIIVVFGGTVFAYFYFRDKAKTAVNINTVRQESSSTTSVNNLATIPTYLNNQDTFLPTDTTNMAVDKNKEKSISDI